MDRELKEVPESCRKPIKLLISQNRCVVEQLTGSFDLDPITPAKRAIVTAILKIRIGPKFTVTVSLSHKRGTGEHFEVNATYFELFF